MLPDKVIRFGLEYIGLPKERQSSMSQAFKEQVFHWHYGSNPLDIAEIWYDLQQNQYEGAFLTDKENTLKGFKRYMIAHFFLWTYPRNAGLMSTRFDIAERYCRGQELWKWIKKIAALAAKKIKWDYSLGDPEKSAFVGSIDCVDCKIWEKRSHYHLNIDSGLCSHKMSHAALKYEIVMDISRAKCMSIVQAKAGEHDMNVFRMSTKDKMLMMPSSKKLIADSIYRKGRKPEQQNEATMFSIPSSLDDLELKRFKSRARARHESFNGRLKFFAFLRDGYRGTCFDLHKEAFTAICVIVQYQMDNGTPIFDVN